MQADPVSPAIDLPPWTGEPCRELPPTAITRPDELMRTLIRSDFCFGMDIVQTLNRSIARKLRGGELHEYPNGHFVVTLWLAYLFNERMKPDEVDPHAATPLPEAVRWHDTELAFSSLAGAWTHVGAELGFVYCGQRYAYHWPDYCKHYPFPPQFVRGWWRDYEGDEDEEPFAPG